MGRVKPLSSRRRVSWSAEIARFYCPRIERLEERAMLAHLKFLSVEGNGMADLDIYSASRVVENDPLQIVLGPDGGDVGGPYYASSDHGQGGVLFMQAADDPLSTFAAVAVTADVPTLNTTAWDFENTIRTVAEANASLTAVYRLVPDDGEGLGDPASVRIDLNYVEYLNSVIELGSFIGSADVEVSYSIKVDDVTLRFEEVDLVADLHIATTQASVFIGQTITVDLDVSASAESFFDDEFGFPGGNIGEARINVNLAIERDIVVHPTTALLWRDAEAGGGVDFTYEIQNRLATAAVASFFWADTPDATSGVPAAPDQTTVTTQGEHHIIVPAVQFIPPPNDKPHLVVVVDRAELVDEASEDNNRAAKMLEIVPPTVELQVTPEDLIKAIGFDLIIHVTNNGPVPLNYVMDWAETWERPLRGGELIAVEGNGPGEPTNAGNLAVGRKELDATIGPIAVGKRERVGPTEQFTLKWDWIDPVNPIAGYASVLNKQATKSALKELASSLGGVLSLESWISALKRILVDPQRELDANFAVTLKDATTSGMSNISSDVDVVVEVSNAHNEYYGAYNANRVAGTSAIGGAIAAGIATIAVPNPVTGFGSFALLVLGLGALRLAKDNYDNAQDPPDFNYSEIVQPDPIEITRIEELPSGLLRTLAKMTLEHESLQKAVYISQNRADGAALDGAPLWHAKQLRAVAQYSARASEFAFTIADLQQQLALLIDSTYPLSAIASYVEANGFPESLITSLRSLDLSDAEIQDLRQSVVETTFSEDDFQLGVDSLKLSSLLASLTAIDVTSQAAAIDVQLGEPVRSLSSLERGELDDLRNEIENQLLQEVPSLGLHNNVRDFLARVRELIDMTNNPEGLREDIDFGFRASAAIRQYHSSVDTLRALVSERFAAGHLTSEVRDLLIGSLDAALEGLGHGSFALVATQLLGFRQTVSNFEGDGIHLETARDLRLFSGFLTSIASGQVGQFDFADSPNPYSTLLEDDGPRHSVGSLFLGAVIDVDNDGHPDVSATGDDQNGEDDEDGVILPTTLFAGFTNTISVTASASGLLDAWIDFDNSGTFDSSEQIAASLPLEPGSNDVAVNVPAVAAGGVTYARFRLSSAGGLGPGGEAADGEVEDYQVQVQALVPDSALLMPDPADPSQNALLIVGTAGHDQIFVTTSDSENHVRLNDRGWSFAEVSRVIAMGLGGNDQLHAATSVYIPTEFYGGPGNDILSAGSGPSILVGGDGLDLITGGRERDLLVGGFGWDFLYGLGEDDILIADDLLRGSPFEVVQAAARDVSTRWQTDESYRDRVNELQAELASMITSTDSLDVLLGGDGADWLLDAQGASGAGSILVGLVHAIRELVTTIVNGEQSYNFQTMRAGTLDVSVSSTTQTGITVQLLDPAQQILATGKSDSQGRVHFEKALDAATSGTVKVMGSATNVTVKVQNRVAENDLLDVNRDGHVSAIDLISLVSRLNTPLPAQLDTTSVADGSVYFDTNQDGYVTSIDLLAVVERLRRPLAPASTLATKSGDAIDDVSEIALALNLQPTKVLTPAVEPWQTSRTPTAIDARAEQPPFEWDGEGNALTSYFAAIEDHEETDPVAFDLELAWLE